MQNVEISSIAYHLGHPAPIAELPLAAADRERLMGPEGGLLEHRVSEDSCLALAIASAKKTLELARREQPDLKVDLIVFTSNSLPNREALSWTSGLAKALDLPNTAAHFINGGDCCNFQVGARFCHGVVAASPQTRILFVTADRVADVCPGEFLAVHGAGVNSDGAASCLFSSGGSNGFRLGGFFAHAQDSSLLEANSNASAFAKIMTMIRSLCARLFQEHQLTGRDIAQVMTNTHTNAVSEMVGLAARVDLDKVFRGNIPVTAHCFAADNLINLHSYAASKSENGPILLIGSGVHQWGGFMVQRTSVNPQVTEVFHD